MIDRNRFVLLMAALMAITLHAGAADTPPNDSGLYQMVIVINPTPTPADAALLAAIDGEPTLAAIAKQCKRYRFPASDPLYLSRYAATLQPSALPAVALVRSDGGILYKACGAEIPAAGELARRLVEIATADRIANPRAIHAGPSNGPPQMDTNANPTGAIQWTPPGGRILSPTIAPRIEIGPEAGALGGVAIGAVLLALIVPSAFFCVVVFAVVVAVAAIVLRD
jgi:hypothetical protein